MRWQKNPDGTISINGKKLLIPVGLGYFGIGGAYGDRKGEADYYRITEEFFKLGGTLLDTAPLYGLMEETEWQPEMPGAGKRADGEIILGRVLDQLTTEGKIIRSAYALMSKFGFVGPLEISNDPDVMKASVEESIRRLFPNPEQPLDEKYIDVLWLHRHIEKIEGESAEDAKLRMLTLARAMCDLIDKGIVKNVGLCEVNALTIEAFHEAMIQVASEREREENYYADRFIGVQSEYSIGNRHSMERPLLSANEDQSLSAEEDRPIIAPSVFEICKTLGKLIFPFSPFAKGQIMETKQVGDDDSSVVPASIFYREGSISTISPDVLSQTSKKENLEANQKKIRELIPIARRYGLTLQALALVWCRVQEHRTGLSLIPLISTGNVEHLQANLRATLKPFSPEVLDRMYDEVNDWYEYAGGFRGLLGSRSGILGAALATGVATPRFKQPSECEKELQLSSELQL